MIRQIYNRQELPMDELQRVGLARDGLLILDKDDIDALLAGRRTEMLRLENLADMGIHIPALDAKLSLRRDAMGKLALLVHPIYREPEEPGILTDTEAEMLEKGEVPNIQKLMFNHEGQQKKVLVEFDKETNEFIITDTDLIQVPQLINNKPLTAAQKALYQKGKEVETEDGTTIQYSSVDKHGIRSNKIALIASVLIDGGVSFVLFKALNTLFNKKQDKSLGKNYEQALKDMTAEQVAAKGTVLAPDEDFEEETSQAVNR